MNTFVTYCRKSTSRQENSYDTQMDAINSFIAVNGGIIVKSYFEAASGADDQRKVLSDAVNDAVSNGHFLIVSTSCRLARSLYTVARLTKIDGLRIVVAELGSIQASNLMLELKSVIAAEERAAISRRVKDTFATLRAQGRTFGRSDFGALEGSKGRDAYKRKCDAFAETIIPRIQALKLSGICSYTSIAKHLNLAGFTTVNGKKWFPATVRNLMLTYG